MIEVGKRVKPTATYFRNTGDKEETFEGFIMTVVSNSHECFSSNLFPYEVSFLGPNGIGPSGLFAEDELEEIE